MEKRFRCRETIVDYKFRLRFPDFLVDLIRGVETVCLDIDEENGNIIVISLGYRDDFPYDIKVTFDHGAYRILIPPELRASETFYYGKTITLAYCREEGIIELWPRPQN